MSKANKYPAKNLTVDFSSGRRWVSETYQLGSPTNQERSSELLVNLEYHDLYYFIVADLTVAFDGGAFQATDVELFGILETFAGALEERALRFSSKSPRPRSWELPDTYFKQLVNDKIYPNVDSIDVYVTSNGLVFQPSLGNDGERFLVLCEASSALTVLKSTLTEFTEWVSQAAPAFGGNAFYYLAVVSLLRRIQMLELVGRLEGCRE